MSSSRFTQSLDLARDRRTSRAVESRRQAIEAQLAGDLDELYARGKRTEQELAMNSAIVSTAASNEMLVSERMMLRAGSSRVAQTIAADRINRLMQADDRTMSRGGF